MSRDEIYQLRDAAVALLTMRGHPCSSLGIERLDVRIDGIQISLRPAFDIGNSYGLDIWAPNKVLNVEWNEAGHIKTMSFRRGNWEKALLSAAQMSDPNFRWGRYKEVLRHRIAGLSNSL